MPRYRMYQGRNVLIFGLVLALLWLLLFFFIFMKYGKRHIQDNYSAKDFYLNDENPDELGRRSTPLINLKVPGPATLCPSSQSNIELANRVNFVDSSGEKCLLLRSICGIESTARANPDMDIFMYMNNMSSKDAGSTRNNETPGKVRNCDVMSILKEMTNVHLVREDLKQSYLSYPKWKVVEEWSPHHMSDAVKMELTRLYGGITMDTDIITFRSLRCFQGNLVHVASLNSTANILRFNPNHPFISYLIRSATFHFRVDDQLAFSWPAVTRAFKEFCRTESIAAGLHLCHMGSNLTLSSDSTVYPIKPSNWINYFLHSFDLSDVRAFNTSFLAHIYLSDRGVPAPISSLFSSLARYYCPATWKAVQLANLTDLF